MNSPILRKITLSILAVSLGGILVSGLFINTALNNQFKNYLNRMDLAREEQTVNALKEIYSENNGWPTPPAILGAGRGNFWGNLSHVTDPEGRIVILSRRGILNNQPDLKTFRKRFILINGRRVGIAYFRQNKIQDFLSRQNELFRATINRSIILAILLTGFISILVAAFLAKRLSTPIREINQTAKEMTAGNLNARVKNLPADEIGELGRSINQFAEQITKVDALRKKMTADVAHDLRTPLAIVRGHLEGMIDAVLPASPENLASLLEEVNRLSRLVRDLQEIASADAATPEFHWEQLDLRVFLQNIVKKHLPLYNEKKIALELSDAGPFPIRSDKEALGKIFDNLLSNAFKYTPSGKKVTVRLEKRPHQAVIHFIDQGIGIAAPDLPYIFERFYRTDQSRGRESGGFGLGLTIVRELVEALGGRITAASELGAGSAFTVILPVNSHESTEH